MTFVHAIQCHSQVMCLEGLPRTEEEFREKGWRLLREEKIHVGLEGLKRRSGISAVAQQDTCRIGCLTFEFTGQGSVVLGEALFVIEDEGPFLQRCPCTSFFG